MRQVRVQRNKFFTQREFETGIWQFLIDHSVRVDKNLIKIIFYTTSKEDFYRRIYSRVTGVYKIKDENKVAREIKNSIQKYEQYKALQRKKDAEEELIRQLPNWKKQAIYSLRKFVKYLIKKWTKQNRPKAVVVDL